MQDTTIKIRVGTTELEMWKQNAKAAGISLSAWVRSRCSPVLYVDAEHPTAVRLENAIRAVYAKPIEMKCEHGKGPGEVCYKCDKKFGYPSVANSA